MNEDGACNKKTNITEIYREGNMDYAKILEIRQSTRGFKPEQLSAGQIEAILDAGMHAPVGSNLYENVHITVVKNQEI